MTQDLSVWAGVQHSDRGGQRGKPWPSLGAGRCQPGSRFIWFDLMGSSSQQWRVPEETDPEKKRNSWLEIFLKETENKSRHQLWAPSPPGFGTYVQESPRMLKPTVLEAANSWSGPGQGSVPLSIA